jgi:hypothetical protein
LSGRETLIINDGKIKNQGDYDIMAQMTASFAVEEKHSNFWVLLDSWGINSPQYS